MPGAGPAFAHFRDDTLDFLRTTPLTIGHGAGPVDTFDTELFFGVDEEGNAFLGDEGNVRTPCGGPGAELLEGIGAHFTPMRPGAMGNGRTGATAVVPYTSGADLWATVRLSGCTVLIIDWGGSLSMVHLQPSPESNFNWFSKKLLGLSTYSNREMHRYSLQGEVTKVVNATRPMGGTPHRYIAVQSQWSILGLHFICVAGWRRDGLWTFYMQEYERGIVHNARELEWQTWDSWSLRYTVENV